MQSVIKDSEALKERYARGLKLIQDTIEQRYQTKKEKIDQSQDTLVPGNNPYEDLDQWRDQKLKQAKELLDQKHRPERKNLMMQKNSTINYLNSTNPIKNYRSKEVKNCKN